MFIVQANTPQRISPLEGSHGQSRIVGPDGTIIREASIFKEEVLIEILDLTSASGDIGERGRQADFLKGMWNKGLKLVKEVDN